MVRIWPCETHCEKHVHCQCEGEIHWCYKVAWQNEELQVEIDMNWKFFYRLLFYFHLKFISHIFSKTFVDKFSSYKTTYKSKWTYHRCNSWSFPYAYLTSSPSI